MISDLILDIFYYMKLHIFSLDSLTGVISQKVSLKGLNCILLPGKIWWNIMLKRIKSLSEITIFTYIICLFLGASSDKTEESAESNMTCTEDSTDWDDNTTITMLIGVYSLWGIAL